VKRGRVLAALALLYATQGIPFGLAAEYLPIVLRRSGASLATIAALTWLQLPWQAKILWAGVADRPATRERSRTILLVLQLALAVIVASYAIVPFVSARTTWFAITALAALFAATQDVFVDATAVRVLGPEERGVGNVAQVAGYRLGILIGGAGLLIVVVDVGERPELLVCASIVATAGIAAFALRDTHAVDARERSLDRLATRELVSHLFARGTWPVIAIACTYKLGLHLASILIKPMVVDAKWTDREIGLAVVTAGTVAGLVGAGFGGLLHKKLGEARALLVAGVVQALACLPLAVAAMLHAPHPLTIAAIGVEHFASGLGTTVLFAALMTATRPANAGLHYTILTSANAMAIGVGGVIGGKLGDRLGYPATYVIAAVCCVLPLALLPRWRTAVAASAG
jgi:predicted MFS family arabinose efflux permease